MKCGSIKYMCVGARSHVCIFKRNVVLEKKISNPVQTREGWDKARILNPCKGYLSK
ncbi:hypothetical protein Hanom_Chr02g00116981 [Helianthus anomalus]